MCALNACVDLESNHCKTQAMCCTYSLWFLTIQLSAFEVSPAMVYDAVSLRIRYPTFRYHVVVTYSRVEVLNNISLPEDVCASLF
jgi:hypothetical protein